MSTEDVFDDDTFAWATIPDQIRLQLAEYMVGDKLPGRLLHAFIEGDLYCFLPHIDRGAEAGWAAASRFVACFMPRGAYGRRWCVQHWLSIDAATRDGLVRAQLPVFYQAIIADAAKAAAARADRG